MKKGWMAKVFLKPPLARKGEVNDPFIDRFTFVHFMIGFAYHALGFGFGWVVLFALVWELLENPLKVQFPSLFPHGTADTLRNAIGDSLAVIFGWMFYRYVVAF